LYLEPNILSFVYEASYYKLVVVVLVVVVVVGARKNVANESVGEERGISLSLLCRVRAENYMEDVLLLYLVL